MLFFDLDFSCIWQEKLADNTGVQKHVSQNEDLPLG